MTKTLVPVLCFIQSIFASFVFAFQVDVAVSPDSNLSLIRKAILDARRSLLVNIYEFSSPEIADALTQKITEGVTVKILAEGQPVGGISANARTIQKKLIQAMREQGKNCDYFEMSASSVAERRFRFDHAKYIVVDGSSIILGSENYSPTGHPREKSTGNRGWEVFVHDQPLARRFTRTFEQDSSTEYGDVVNLLQSSQSKPDLVTAEIRSEDTSLSSTSSQNFRTYDASSVQEILSPESSLSGLISLLAKAKSSIDIELMTFSPLWGNTGKRSPLLEEVLKAISRGVQVRVLLNDESVFGQPLNLVPNGTNIFAAIPDMETSSARKYKNPVTADMINQLASKQNFKAKGLIADVKAMGVTYIHNKGALVDRDKTLVSSINWNQNSLENNREAALILESPKIHDYYQNLFDQDWKASGGAEL